MIRILAFSVCLLAAIAGNLWLENIEVRRDQEDMKAVYYGFLTRKSGGATLESKIEPGSLALFKVGKNVVGCAMMRGK